MSKQDSHADVTFILSPLYAGRTSSFDNIRANFVDRMLRRGVSTVQSLFFLSASIDGYS
jgi:hypothetical protein